MAVGGKKGGAIAEINVTPMADIMIVLLIIFMVITPMLQKRATSSSRPGQQKERKDEPKSMQWGEERTGASSWPNRSTTGFPQLRESSRIFGQEKMIFLGRREPGVLGGHEDHGSLP
jgi:hypothetical protein